MFDGDWRAPTPADGIGFGIDDQDWTAATQFEVSVLITSDRQDERSRCARWIHEQGRRRESPFVDFDCGSRGASTVAEDADDRVADYQASEMRRRFGEADGGTLFLDRIEMMHPASQHQLFSLLDVTPGVAVTLRTGSRRVRVIAGASDGLLAAVAAGTFHESLFYRLNVIHLDVTNRPSLEGVPQQCATSSEKDSGRAGPADAPMPAIPPARR